MNCCEMKVQYFFERVSQLDCSPTKEVQNQMFCRKHQRNVLGFFFKKHLAFFFFFRYVGENYSRAQEAMEETMHYFYSQRSAHQHLSSPVVGQLVVISAEEGDELARAQVVELMTPNTVKVMVLLVKKLF